MYIDIIYPNTIESKKIKLISACDFKSKIKRILHKIFNFFFTLFNANSALRCL